MLEPQLSLCKMFLGSNDWQFWIVFFILSHAARHRHFKIFGIPVDYKNSMYILERFLLQRCWDAFQNRNQRPMNSQMEIFSSFFFQITISLFCIQSHGTTRFEVQDTYLLAHHPIIHSIEVQNSLKYRCLIQMVMDTCHRGK